MSEPRANDWAVVLGCSSGTGAAVARVAARVLGHHVYGAHRGNFPDEARAVEADIRAARRAALIERFDAGTAAGAEQGAEALLAAAGPRSVKLFVHSLASASVGRLLSPASDRVVPSQFQKTFELMAHSFCFWAEALVSRDLLAPGALLLGLSNPMVDTSVRGTALIAASKAALEVYVRHLAQELGPRGHRVNLLKFGAVFTPAFRRTFGDPRMQHMEQVLERVIPAGRTLSAEEVADVIAFLASPGARFFNGATIDLTGGETQHLLDALLFPDRDSDEKSEKKDSP